MSVTLAVLKLSGWLKAELIKGAKNISRMLVTRDVSQLEMSALKLRNSSKSRLMSVMAETFQPAMGPYFATASVELASYCRTAVSRWALIVNMLAS